MNRKDKQFFLAYGLLIWALATVSLKVIGLDEQLMWLNFLALVIGMPLLNLAGYWIRGIKGVHQVKASALFACSGMLLDAFVMLIYPRLVATGFFARMPEQGHYLGAWLLLGNSLTLITALLSAELGQKARPTSTIRPGEATTVF